MPKPRLLIVLNRLSIGGPATNVLSSAALLSNEFDILLIAGEPLPHEQSAAYLLHTYKGFTVEILPLLRRSVIPGKDFLAYRAIKKKIRKFQPQVVHTHGAKPGLLGRLAAWRCGVPVIIHTFHGHIFHSYFNTFLSWFVVKVEQTIARISTAVIAINEKLRTELIYTYKITVAEKVKLIRLGIETEKLNDPDGILRKTFRTAFHVPDDCTAVGIVGRLVPVKNHSLFAEAAAIVLQKNKNIRFFVIGDGQEKASIQMLLKQKGIEFMNTDDNPTACSAPVIFTSWRTDMNAVFAGLDINVLTSLNEGTPVSIMEAMAAGKAVVSTPVGGVAELLENGKTGILCSSEATIAAAIIHLADNPQEREMLGSNARQLAEAEFSKQHEVAKLSSLYKALLSEKLKK